jgi:glycosyltransferase involved in cell wall biosynthesis
MKIAYILPVYWPAFGGCELHTHELVGRLSERFAIRVITQITRQEDKPGDLWLGTLVKAIPRRERYFDNKAEVVPVRMNPLERHILCPFVRLHRGMEVFSMGIIDYIFQRKIFGLLKDSDLIHCIHNGASFYGYAAMHCAKKLNVPFVFTPLFQLYQLWNESASGMKEENGNVWELTRGRHLHAHLSARCYHDRFWFDVCRAADALITMTGFEKEEGVLCWTWDSRRKDPSGGRGAVDFKGI